MERPEVGTATHAVILDETASKRPDMEAIVYKDRSLTWAELREQSRKLSKAFLKAGLKKGDRIGILMTNIPEWAVVRHAIHRIGAWLVPVNTRYKTSELKTLLRKGELNGLVLMESALGIDFVELLYRVCPELATFDVGIGRVRIRDLPSLRSVVYLGNEDHPGMYRFSRFIESGSDVSDEYLSSVAASIGAGDVSTLMFTAGTTGTPKGVLTTHSNFVRVFSKMGERFGLTERDVILGAAPFFTNFGLCTVLIFSELFGCKVVAFESFDPAEILKGIEEHKITVFAGTPAMYYMLLNHESFDRRKVQSMRVGDIAGAPVSPEMVREVIEKFGMTLFGVYGMTETTGVITMTEPGDSPMVVAHTVGRNFNEGCETRVVDVQTREPLPPGEVGEIVTKGWHVTQGYYKDAALFAQCWDEDGWFRTGDLGRMDENGYLTFVGRLKDIIISGGINIDPMEIENFIGRHPAVESVHVVGLPDRRMGEVVGAFIKAKAGVDCSAEDIRSFCQGRIAKYKIPTYVGFLDEVPRTAVGKVQKHKLRERGVEEFHLIGEIGKG